MKNNKRILMIAVFLLCAVGAYAACECDGETTDYDIDCNADGVMDACDTSDCGPCEAGNPPSSGKLCCDNTEFDPTPTTWTKVAPISFATLNTKYSNAIASLNTGGCWYSASSNGGAGISVRTTKVCCISPGGDEIKDLKEFKGVVTADFGGFTCTQSLVNVPYLISVNVGVSASMDVTVTASGEETCDDTDVCFGASANFSLSGSISARVFDKISFIDVTAVVTTDTSAEAEYCTDTGFDGDVCVKEVRVDVEATVFYVLTINSSTYSLYSNTSC